MDLRWKVSHWVWVMGVCAWVLGCDDGDASNPGVTLQDVAQDDTSVLPPDTAGDEGDTSALPPDSTGDEVDAEGPLCGNGLIDLGERCDLGIEAGELGACPVACEPVQGCLAYALAGAGCDRRCESAPITRCEGGDGCCPQGCANADDSDCSDTCGNGVLDPDELCDGDCPTACEGSPSVCEQLRLVGDASTCSARCEAVAITTCTNDDGCCPSICNDTTDIDCVIPITCGNGQPDPGELCDGDCPSTCTAPSACEPVRLVGTPERCNVECEPQEPITECGSGDRCCPSGCDADADADCRPPWSCAPTLLLLGGYDDIQALSADALRQALNARVIGHTNLGYDLARDYMFNQFDVNASNQIECIYTGRFATPNGTRTPGNFNTEHSWPRNDAAGDSTAASEPAEADLHHLYPTDANANNKRASLDYGWTDCGTSGQPGCDWEEALSQLGDARGTPTTNVFEVRPKYRGDVARAHFYFAVRYERPIPDAEEAALRAWHCEDPPDAVERARNDAIHALQRNRNPFIDRPDFVDYIPNF